MVPWYDLGEWNVVWRNGNHIIIIRLAAMSHHKECIKPQGSTYHMLYMIVNNSRYKHANTCIYLYNYSTCIKLDTC